MIICKAPYPRKVLKAIYKVSHQAITNHCIFLNSLGSITEQQLLQTTASFSTPREALQSNSHYKPLYLNQLPEEHYRAAVITNHCILINSLRSITEEQPLQTTVSFSTPWGALQRNSHYKPFYLNQLPGEHYRAAAITNQCILINSLGSITEQQPLQTNVS